MTLIKKIYRILPNKVRDKVRNLYYLKKFKSASWDDEKDLSVLKYFIHPGNTVIDIGANFGLYTRFMAELTGAQGKVYSFEPVPDMFQTLQYNVIQMELTQVNVVELAVSDKSGKATIHIPTYEDGSENYYEASLSISENKKGIEIQAIRLDEWNVSIENIHFIKMDVEGHEPQALAGARKLITTYSPPIMIEINDGFDAGSIGEKVRKQLMEWGYSMYYFDNNKIRASIGKENGVNYLFLTPSHLQTDEKENF